MQILIVEDVPLIALTLEQTFGELGFEDVQIALSLGEAERLVASCDPDLAVLDVNIGNVLVFPFAQTLKSRGVPILFVTARPIGDMPEEWAGSAFLQKPADTPRLSAALRALGHVSVTPGTAGEHVHG